MAIPEAWWASSMSELYIELLEATIAHLEALRDRGVAWVPVRRETLLGLSPSAARPESAGSTTAGMVSRGPAPLSPSPSPGPGAGVSLAASLASPPPVVPSSGALSRWSRAISPLPDAPPSARSPLPPPLAAEARIAALEELRGLILACSKCSHLVGSRHSVVFGVGDPSARILFVGEAPGADEDLQGEPFVGKAGELLTKIITAMGLSRDSVFIANILKCRPDTPGQTSGNRKPRPDEMATCLPWLERQIDLIQPRVLVALGATAVEGLLGKGLAGITQLRGSWQEHRGIPVMPTYHPAYLLRNQALSEKRKVWEDMLQVLDRAGYPISAKQRGFFLNRE